MENKWYNYLGISLGDALGIFPQNAVDEVDDLLAALCCQEDEVVTLQADTYGATIGKLCTSIYYCYKMYIGVYMNEWMLSSQIQTKNHSMHIKLHFLGYIWILYELSWIGTTKKKVCSCSTIQKPTL